MYLQKFHGHTNHPLFPAAASVGIPTAPSFALYEWVPWRIIRPTLYWQMYLKQQTN